jgi:hypothetical protein
VLERNHFPHVCPDFIWVTSTHQIEADACKLLKRFANVGRSSASMFQHRRINDLITGRWRSGISAISPASTRRITGFPIPHKNFVQNAAERKDIDCTRQRILLIHVRSSIVRRSTFSCKGGIITLIPSYISEIRILNRAGCRRV